MAHRGEMLNVAFYNAFMKYDMSDARDLPRPDTRPELDIPSYQILENSLS